MAAHDPSVAGDRDSPPAKPERKDAGSLLRLLRRHLRECDGRQDAREAILRAIEAVRSLDIPHLERLDDIVDGEVVH